MKYSQKRQDIIDTAILLFGIHGFHNTGVNLIMEKAKISKKTLYMHFRSKDELIAAALQYHDAVTRNHFMKTIDGTSHDPIEKLIAIFDVTQNWFASNDFFGCIFINAIAEFSEFESPIQSVCNQYKKSKRDYIKKLCAEAKLSNPDRIADELSLLIEGATVTAQVSKSTAAAETAKRIAIQLIDAAKPNS